MSRVRDELSADENIIELFFDSSGRMFEEPTNLMKQESRNCAIHNSVISAIATGSSRMNDIAAKVGEDSAACTNQIKTLISLGIVKEEVPGHGAGEKPQNCIFS